MSKHNTLFTWYFIYKSHVISHKPILNFSDFSSAPGGLPSVRTLKTVYTTSPPDSTRDNHILTPHSLRDIEKQNNSLSPSPKIAKHKSLPATPSKVRWEWWRHMTSWLTKSQSWKEYYSAFFAEKSVGVETFAAWHWRSVEKRWVFVHKIFFPFSSEFSRVFSSENQEE